MGLQHLTELSPEQQKLIHHHAYTYYKQAQYEKAYELFHFLTIINVDECAYWIGSGASLQMLKKYSAALDAYEKAVLLDPLEISIYLYVADCLFCLDRAKDGIETLKTANEVAQETKNVDYVNLIAMLLAERAREMVHG